jgi:hypothetical protein
VGAVWVTLAIASGLYFSFPIFFVALLEEFGWSRGATAAAFSISSIVHGVVSPVVGMLVDRWGHAGSCSAGRACSAARASWRAGSAHCGRFMS